ncbi:BsuPI-related putative proteinase inhibitor [Cytobacillus sp. Hz8]|uniref:BsuPI-related putative proteinase inhibitor n=1 Tax=Cytobacillus sp. Hz8 TaxID=3347168 RepID=UPI0035DA98E3
MKRILGLMVAFILMVPLSGFAYENTGEYSFDFFVVPTIGTEKTNFDIVLKNSGNLPVQFEFPTSQKYELRVKDSEGKDAYVYSKNQSFFQGIQTIILKPNEEKRWRESWNNQVQGKRVQEGQYTLEAVLTSTKRNHLNAIPVKYETEIYIPKSDSAFQNFQVIGREGKYQIIGQVRPHSGEFYYTVEDGHNEIIKETRVIAKSKFPQWSPIHWVISIGKEKLPKNGAFILHLYERDGKGTITESSPVLLEKFTEER